MKPSTPPKLTPDEIATIRWGSKVSSMSTMHPMVTLTNDQMDDFARAIESALTAKWLEMLEGQEAVAWTWPGTMRTQFTDSECVASAWSKDGLHVSKLYAAPVPAKAPMTDEQIEMLLVNWPKDGIAFIEFARAIEAHHGIADGGEG